MLKITTILCLFVSLLCYSQKEIQPYQYSDTDENITFFIYAEPESVNNVTFIFKDSDGKPILMDKKPITFKVYPLQEKTFTKVLEEKLIILKSLNHEKFKNIEASNDSQLRNIYQFFNALINTAFEYDTEPVAGVLKYELETEVLKKTIEGYDTNLFFTKKAKIIRKVIIDQNYTDALLIKKNELIKNDPFLKKIDTTDIKRLVNFNRNTRKNKLEPKKNLITHQARNKFKHFTKQYLQEIYNTFEIKNVLDDTTIVKKALNNNSKKSFSTYYIEKLSELKKYKKQIAELKKDSIKNRNKKNEFESQYKGILNESNSVKKTEKEIRPLIDYFQSRIIKSEDIRFDLSKKNENTNEITNLIKSDKQEIIQLESKLKSTGDIKLLNDKLNKIKKDILSTNSEIKQVDSLVRVILNQKDKILAETAILLQKLPLWKFKASLVELDINDGFIEHMVVVGKLIKPVLQEDYIRRLLNKDKSNDLNSTVKLEEAFNSFFEEQIIKKAMSDAFGKELKFDNEFPIGFSSKIDFADLHNYTLFNFEGYEKKFSLPITNIITNYIQRHQNDRLDFSPKDQVLTLPLNDTDNNGSKELKKERSSKILSAKVFSDFNGFREETPNGLIQFEVDKEIPIWTKRFFLGAGRSSNFGVLNYAKFNFTWAKTEERDRDLQVRTDERTNQRFATYLDFIRFQNISFGGDLNLASFSFPIAKARLEINGGLHYNRTNVVDTLSTNPFNKQTNTIRIYPDFILRIRPEERFGGYFRFRPTRLSIPASRNESFFVVNSDEDANGNRQTLIDQINNTEFPQGEELPKVSTNFNGQSQIGWVYRYEFSSFFQPSASSDSKFFFRYRYTNDSDFSSNGYSEFQVGYLMFLKF